MKPFPILARDSQAVDIRPFGREHLGKKFGTGGTNVIIQSFNSRYYCNLKLHFNFLRIEEGCKIRAGLEPAALAGLKAFHE